MLEACWRRSVYKGLLKDGTIRSLLARLDLANLDRTTIVTMPKALAQLKADLVANLDRLVNVLAEQYGRQLRPRPTCARSSLRRPRRRIERS
jgi:hypothetical protein